MSAPIRAPSETGDDAMEEVIEALVRLAQGDFSVRLERSGARDSHDALATLVNILAEELEHLVATKDREREHLEAGIAQISEALLAMAAGDYHTQIERELDGSPLDVIAYMVNNSVTEVGELVERLNHRKSQVEAILESMDDGVLVLDAGSRILESNAAVERLLLRRRDALCRSEIGSLLRDDEQRGRLSNLLDGEVRRRLREPLVFLDANGEPVELNVNASPIAGSVHGAAWVMVIRDERELRQAQARLQIADRMTAMGTMAAGVAHEINNPLAYIAANVDFVHERLAAGATAVELEQEALLDALHDARTGADRVRDIVRDLKAFTRGDEEHVGRVVLNDLLRSAAAMVNNEIRHRAQLVWELGDIPAITANDTRLGQVFLNLMINAAHAIEAGRAESNEIRVVSTTDGRGQVIVEVRDTGCGIPEHSLDQIFEVFYTTKPVGVGTGLGLSICKKIVTSLGGHIEVESRVGIGSTFRVFLPADIALASPLVEHGPRDRPTEQVGRLLVIDDEPKLASAVRRALRGWSDITFLEDGRKALDLLGRESFDVILCDLMMPKMSGMELFAHLRRDHPAAAERVVFLTGGAFTPEAREFLAQIDNRWLEKPFESSELRRLLSEVVGAHPNR